MQQRAGKSASRPLRLQFELRKRGRAVEGTGLENRRRGNSFVSSNLTASATNHALYGVPAVQRLFTVRSTSIYYCAELCKDNGLGEIFGDAMPFTGTMAAPLSEQ